MSGRNKIRVLILTSHYLPGYKAGGPIISISNIVNTLSTEFIFKIITLNHDQNDKNVYNDIITNKWNKIGTAKVFYLNDNIYIFKNILKLLRETEYDIIYLNSYFTIKTTLIPLFLLRILSIKKAIILAPRGEFSIGAIRIKSIRKKIYIITTKILGIYDSILWQASSILEKKDIKRELKGVANNVLVAPNILKCENVGRIENINTRVYKEHKPLKIIFISRISPKKNLHYLLEVLSRVTADIKCTIHGILEDTVYWNKCKKLIKLLPSNIKVYYQGPVSHDKVNNTFGSHDLFVFPTKGENFGHVIFESLSAGTSVIITDKTPWKPDKKGAVETIPLCETKRYVESIERWASYDRNKLSLNRKASIEYANSYLKKQKEILKMNYNLFQTALLRG